MIAINSSFFYNRVENKSKVCVRIIEQLVKNSSLWIQSRLHLLYWLLRMIIGESWKIICKRKYFLSLILRSNNVTRTPPAEGQRSIHIKRCITLQLLSTFSACHIYLYILIYIHSNLKRTDVNTWLDFKKEIKVNSLIY